MFKRVLVSLAVAGCLASCSSRILHSEIDPKLDPGSKIEGVPYRMPKRYKATVYEKTEKGYKPLKELLVTIPDPTRLYVLGFRSDVLSTATLDIQMNVDNTLSQVALKSSSAAPALVTEVGKGLTSIAAAEQARLTAEATAKTAAAAVAAAAKTAETTAATAAIAADKAKQAADLAELQYQLAKANPSTTAENLLKAEHTARSAKLDANEAARVAGRPPYFPEVVP